jgi:hypothetical protein
MIEESRSGYLTNESGSGSRRSKNKWIRIPPKLSKTISCLEVPDVVFRGLEASSLAWKTFMEAEKYIRYRVKCHFE